MAMAESHWHCCHPVASPAAHCADPCGDAKEVPPQPLLIVAVIAVIAVTAAIATAGPTRSSVFHIAASGLLPKPSVANYQSATSLSDSLMAKLHGTRVD